MEAISGIILAGGESRRMGVNKALLTVGGQPLIRRVVDVVAQVADELIIVADQPGLYAHLGARVIKDILPGRGALGGIYSGLRGACHFHCLVVACDMPFLNLNLLRYMVTCAPGWDIVIPRLHGWLEPLHALYSRACLDPIKKLFSEGNLKIIDLLPEVRVRYLEAEEIELFDGQYLCFTNVNTPGELIRARRLVTCSAEGGYQAHVQREVAKLPGRIPSLETVGQGGD